MTNLIISKNNSTGFSAYINQETGEAFLTASLIIQISGIDHKVLDKIIRSEGVGNYASEVNQLLTEGGKQGVGILVSASDFKRIIKAWNPRAETQITSKEKLIDGFIDAGVTAFVYNLCGYKLALPQPKQTPDEYWIEFRDSGKDYQLGEWTNCMVNFSHYAVAQGSNGYKNPSIASIQFTEMFNRVILEDYNSKVRGKGLDVRDRLGVKTLGLIHLLQETQVNLIQQEMLAGTHYKEIFRLVKNRILGLIEAMYIKPVALLSESNRKLINHSLDSQLALEAA